MLISILKLQKTDCEKYYFSQELNLELSTLPQKEKLSNFYLPRLVKIFYFC